MNVAAGAISGVGGSGAELVIAPAAGKGKVFVRTDTDADGDVFDNPASESFYRIELRLEQGVRLGAGDSDHSGSYVEVFTAPGPAGRKAVKIYDDTLDPGAVLHDNPITQAFKAFPRSVKAGAYVALAREREAVHVAHHGDRDSRSGGRRFEPVDSELARRIRNLTVILNLTHTFDADLDVTLTHVATGTSVTLFTDARRRGRRLPHRPERRSRSGHRLGRPGDGRHDHFRDVQAGGACGPFDLRRRQSRRLRPLAFLTVTDDLPGFSGTISSWGLDVVY